MYLCCTLGLGAGGAAAVASFGPDFPAVWSVFAGVELRTRPRSTQTLLIPSKLYGLTAALLSIRDFVFLKEIWKLSRWGSVEVHGTVMCFKQNRCGLRGG